MNRTIRNLIVAAPLVLVGITMAPGAAMADGFDIVDAPQPPKPPKGPQDIAIPTPPKPPKGPKDLADAPKPQAPKPTANPQAGDTTEADTTEATFVVSAKGSPDSIDRSDNLFVAGPAETELVADNTDNGGVDMTWLLVGGGVVTASGIAFAARKRTNA